MGMNVDASITVIEPRGSALMVRLRAAGRLDEWDALVVRWLDGERVWDDLVALERQVTTTGQDAAKVAF